MKERKKEENKPIFTGTIFIIKSPLMDKSFGAVEGREEARSWGIKLKGEKLDDRA